MTRINADVEIIDRYHGLYMQNMLWPKLRMITKSAHILSQNITICPLQWLCVSCVSSVLFSPGTSCEVGINGTVKPIRLRLCHITVRLTPRYAKKHSHTSLPGSVFSLGFYLLLAIANVVIVACWNGSCYIGTRLRMTIWIYPVLNPLGMNDLLWKSCNKTMQLARFFSMEC